MRLSWRWGLLAAALAATAIPALLPGDAAVADQMWEAARLDKGGHFDARLFVQVAGAQSDIAPWQDAWARAQTRIEVVGRARRRALPDDRGAAHRLVQPAK